MKVELTEDQINFLKCGTCIITKEGKYYYIPYWFKENTDGTFDEITFEQLPIDLLRNLDDLKREKILQLKYGQ